MIWGLAIIFYRYVILTFLWVLLCPFIGNREAYFGGALEALRLLRIQVAFCGNLKNDIKNFQGLILASHKSWSDFYTVASLQFSSCLARISILLVVPGAACAASNGCLLLFRRKTSSPGTSLEVLEEKISGMAERYYNWICNRNCRLLVFPEGHRNPERGILEFRTGTFRIAYKRKIPCLIAPAEGSQNIIQEKKLFLHPQNIDLSLVYADKELNIFDRQDRIDGDGYHLPPSARSFTRQYRGFILYNAHEIVDPKDYPDWKSFMEKCKSSFQEGYKIVCDKYDELVENTSAKKLSFD